MKSVLQDVRNLPGSARTSESLIEEYEDSLGPVREGFDRHPAVLALFQQPLEAVGMEKFLISFAILGIGMTEPVRGMDSPCGVEVWRAWVGQIGQGSRRARPSGSGSSSSDAGRRPSLGGSLE